MGSIRSLFKVFTINLEQIEAIHKRVFEVHAEQKALVQHADELPCIDLDAMLHDFNWQASGDAAALEHRLISELSALEAANVHDIIQSEERANQVVEQINVSLNELNHIEEWLLKYTRLLQVISV